MFSSTGLPVFCRHFSPTFLWMIGVGKDFIRLFLSLSLVFSFILLGPVSSFFGLQKPSMLHL